ncbi:MAG: hypothetical protein Q4C25_00535 [Bacillota bacterium]|nr:hypothetical protein [Bacillota bacterium]
MNRPSGKTLLLIELAILLVFFCFSAVVCVNLFMNAKEKTEDARLLDNAVVETTSIAETLKATDGDMWEAGRILSGSENGAGSGASYDSDGGAAGDFDLDDGRLTLYYDKEMHPCQKSEALFHALIIPEEETDLWYSYSISIYSIEDGGSAGSGNGAESAEIYALSFKAMKAGGRYDD